MCLKFQLDRFTVGEVPTTAGFRPNRPAPQHPLGGQIEKLKEVILPDFCLVYVFEISARSVHCWRSSHNCGISAESAVTHDSGVESKNEKKSTLIDFDLVSVFQISARSKVPVRSCRMTTKNANNKVKLHMGSRDPGVSPPFS